MDDYFIAPSLGPAKDQGNTEISADTEESRSSSHQKFIHNSAWKADSGAGTKAGRAGGTRSFRKNGKPPRPPRPSSAHNFKVQKPQDHSTQCEMLLRRTKVEGRCLIKEKWIARSAIMFNTLAALLVTICFLLFTVGQGFFPHKLLSFAQLQVVPQMIQEKFLINTFAKSKLEPQQPNIANLRTLQGHSMLNQLSSAVEKPDKYDLQRGLEKAEIHPKKKDSLLPKAKVRSKRSILNGY